MPDPEHGERGAGWRAGIAATTWRGLASLAPPALAWLLHRRLRIGKEDPARVAERRGLGAGPPSHWNTAARRVWLHAASVGETVSILPVIDELLAQGDVAVLVTTGTRTAAEILARRAPATVAHRFVPYDVPRWIDRLLDQWRPHVAGFVDSEIWPNTLAQLRRRGIPALMVNARLSVRSAARWQLAARVFGATPFGLITAVLARDAADAARIAALGGPVATLIGDLKQAAPVLPVDEAALAALRAAIAGRPVWLAASTHDGEEAAAAEVHARLAPHHPGLLTLIAPRHPERGARIAEALGGIPRRGAGDAVAGTSLYLWDTLGELGLLYRAAEVVFVGNSLGGRASGGHNPYEPARCGAAVATGPATANFLDAVAALSEAGGLAVAADTGALAGWVGRMLSDPAARARQAQAGSALADAGRDLPGQVARHLLDAIGTG